MLVVDDNADAAETVAEALRTYGYDAVTAGDAVTALATVGDEPPSAALLDLGLPPINGFELARALRSRFPGRPLRLIAVTGYGQQDDRQRSREAGFDAHLVKPVDLLSLHRLLAE